MYDVYEIRKQFPMLAKQKYMQGKPLVFLDNASTTFKPQCVIDAVVKYYSEDHRSDSPLPPLPVSVYAVRGAPEQRRHLD